MSTSTLQVVKKLTTNRAVNLWRDDKLHEKERAYVIRYISYHSIKAHDLNKQLGSFKDFELTDQDLSYTLDIMLSTFNFYLPDAIAFAQCTTLGEDTKVIIKEPSLWSKLTDYLVSP